MTADYSYISQEMFNTKLEEVVDHMSSGELLAIPGVSEVLSEHLNNQVLDELDAEYLKNRYAEEEAE